MWIRNKKKTAVHGFTIAELIIVIVVIAILATITIVSYNGVQNNAKLTAAYTTIKSYQSYLKIVAFKGALPNFNACLGPPAGYATGTPRCTVGGQDAWPQPDMNTLLTDAGMKDQPKLTSLDPEYQQIVFSVVYYGNYSNILYNLPGDNVDCGVRPVLSPSPSWGYNGAKNTGYGGGSTTCIVGIDA